MKFISLIFLLVLILNPAHSQDSQVRLLNEVIALMIGPQECEHIPVFESMKDVCTSEYISCDKNAEKIIGLNFQFTNLNGVMPESITQLKDLVWINLEYNYLQGTLPEGLNSLPRLEELLLAGNFFTGPLPADLFELKDRTLVDLAQNVISAGGDKWIEKFNIVDQVNLEGCRSPDSIYINKKTNVRSDDIWGRRPNISVDKDSIKTKAIENPDQTQTDDDIKVVERMPRFPGCEHLQNEKERGRCAKEKMLRYIYKNLRYPDFARNNSVEGMAVIQFIVKEDGNLADVTIVRDPGGRTGNASQWVVNRMNYICDNWTPGYQNSKPVKVLYTLPVKFKLQ